MSDSNYTRHPHHKEFEFPSWEIWTPVKDYAGYYEVSNHGRVKSLPREVKMRDGRTYRVSGKVLEPAWDGRYYHVVLSKGSKERTTGVSKLVLEAFIGSRPEGLVACHNDGDSKNNNVLNLRWGTQKSNQGDRVLHGTSNRNWVYPKGNSYKIRGRIDELVSMWETGKYTKADLARRFGVTYQTVMHHIRRRCG